MTRVVDIAAVVLAGGHATRLGGGDKPLREIGGRPLLGTVLERLAMQAGRTALSANGDPSRYAGYGLPVLPDEDEQAGPLSGILAGMAWARRAGASHLLSVAGDTPFFPLDLAARLADAIGESVSIAVAASGGRRHPVFALWPVALEADLRAFLATTATFSVAAFLDRHPTVTVSFPATDIGGESVDPFFNINTPDDLAAADTIARRPQR
jgi:molybdopterin-guanine dinucleotide biosynthesis protein A